jgi:hypothetical protein
MKRHIAFILCLAVLSTCVVGFECSSGFLDQTVVEITSSAINDNYCDCPLTGEDEPLTNACSGSNSWAGVYDNTKDSSRHHHGFSCMRQPTLVLPMSRLNDGICDCCDGSDEREGQCPDICEEILRKEREERERLQYIYKEGSTKRQADLEHYQRVLEGAMTEMNDLESDLPQLQSRIQTLMNTIQEEKTSRVLRYFHQIDQLLNQVEFATIQLSIEEMKDVIMSTCYLHGEMTDPAKEVDICTPMMDAGMDIGILWKSVDTNGRMNKMKKKKQKQNMSVQIDIHDNPSVLMEIANILMARETGSDIPNVSTSSKDGHDHHLNHNSRDYHDDDMHPLDDYYDDYDVHQEEQDDLSPPIHENAEEDNDYDHGEQYDGFMSKYGILMRSPFYNQAMKIVSQIEEVLDMEASNDSDDESETDSDNDEQSHDSNKRSEGKMIPFDPMAIQMVKNTLSRRISLVEHGNKLAESALEHLQVLEQVLSSEEYASTLKKLFIGTILHSNISAVDAAEIIAVAQSSIDSEVCYSPYFILCDNTTVLPITDGEFKKGLEDRCSVRGIRFCELSTTGDGSSGIPSNIPDGYYNYYIPKPRQENDYLSRISESFYSHIFTDTNIPSLDKDLVTAQNEVDHINSRIKELKNQVGYGDDSTDFGPGGELYALREECLEMSSGKYTYHLCMFQKAKQTESGRGGGVDLGKWDGMSFDQETGQRVMKWKGGSKCWNGPMRSATVFVTCGIETKLVSAEEPNICEYEFRLESHIACDDIFRKIHGL